MIVTSIYAGLLAILFVVLSFRVMLMRRAGHISLGDNGDEGMLRRIRAHANFAEYVPLALLLMVILEIRGNTSPLVIHVLGILLLAGRILHAVALGWSRSFFAGRVVGTGLTLFVLLFAGFLCAWKGLAGMLLSVTAGP